MRPPETRIVKIVSGDIGLLRGDQIKIHVQTDQTKVYHTTIFKLFSQNFLVCYLPLILILIYMCSEH